MTKPVVEGFCDSEFSELESIFAKAIQSGFDDGAGFALEVDGKEVLNLWGGFSDKAHQKPWQQDTLVNVFSVTKAMTCLLYTSPSPRDRTRSRMPSSA